MFRLGVSKLAETKRTALTIFSHKKEWSVRFCLDYKQVNNGIVRHYYIIPKLENFIDPLGDALIFFNLHENGVYCLIQIHDPNCGKKWAFSLPHGPYRFTRSQFELCNPPGTFNWITDVLLLPVRWEIPQMSLDKVSLFPWNFDEHIFHLSTALCILQRLGSLQRLWSASLLPRNRLPWAYNKARLVRIGWPYFRRSSRPENTTTWTRVPILSGLGQRTPAVCHEFCPQKLHISIRSSKLVNEGR